MSKRTVLRPGGRPITVADLRHIPPDGYRYEAIDGSLLVTPTPATAHQIAVFRLAKLLEGIPRALVLPGPLPWIISESEVFQPDVVVAERSAFTERGLEGTPELVVEVTTPATRRMDRGVKRLVYADAGLPRYWVVDPGVPTVWVFSLSGEELVEVAHLEGGDRWEDADLGVSISPGEVVEW